MEPTLKPGTYVLALTGNQLKLKPGDIALYKIGGELQIKRVSKIEHNMYTMTGDNPADSHDSRDFGPVQGKSIIGKVIWH